MADPPSFFDELAARLAERFVAPVRYHRFQDFPEQFALETTPAFLVDVHVATEALGRQCDLLDRRRIAFPCIEPLTADSDRTPIPVSLGFDNALAVDSLEINLESLVSQIWEGTGRLVPVKIVDAIDFFQSRLTGFLSTRLAAASTIAPQTGLPFKVDTKSTGLRVYYAPVYWHSNQGVLNYPSTPVNGSIHSGKYHFGAAVPGQQPQFDFSASYKLPPDTKAYLPF